MDGIQPTYNLADRGYGDGFGFGGGSGIWLFAILALLWGGNGFFGRGGAEARTATVEDLANQSNFTRLESQVLANGQAIRATETNLGNGIANLGYQIATDFGALSKELSSCCCGLQSAILENRYLSAQNTASINANTTAQTQRILDALSQNKIESLQAQVNQLYLKDQLCGIVRYPTSATFTAPNPFWFSNGCNTNI